MDVSCVEGKDGRPGACVLDGSEKCRNAAARMRNPALLLGRSSAKFCIITLELTFHSSAGE